MGRHLALYYLWGIVVFLQSQSQFQRPKESFKIIAFVVIFSSWCLKARVSIQIANIAKERNAGPSCTYDCLNVGLSGI